MAIHPACTSKVFRSYRQAVDRGDVVNQKRRYAIADTRAPVTATSLSPFLYFDLNPHRSRILPVEPLLGARRWIPHGLHCIMSVRGRCGMLHKGRTSRRTWSFLGSFLPSPTTILCHLRAFWIIICQIDYLGRVGNGEGGGWYEGRLEDARGVQLVQAYRPMGLKK